MSIGSRLKEARKKRGLTQEALATAIGVTKGAIANYENEVSIPKIELLFGLMATLDVDANFLYQDDVDFSRPKEKPTTISGDGLSAGEESLVKLFRLVPHEQQDMVLGMIEAALKSQGLL